eukprot:200877_1
MATVHTQLPGMQMSGTILLIILCLAIKYIYHYYGRKTRIVHFKPVVEGNKFQRRQALSSAPIEKVVKTHLIPSAPNPQMTVSFIDGVNEEFAFFIRNVLTTNECQHLIAAAESTGFEPRRYSGKGDDSASCCFQSDSLSNAVIFNRINQFLPSKSYFDADCMLYTKTHSHNR